MKRFNFKRMICLVICVMILSGCTGSSAESAQASDTIPSVSVSSVETEPLAASSSQDTVSETVESVNTEAAYADTADMTDTVSGNEASGYLYEGRDGFAYPVTDEEHTHIGFQNVDGETEELIKEKLTNAKIISDLFRGRVPRADDIDIGSFADFMCPVSLDFYSSDELREICADTFSADAREYLCSYSDSVPEEHYWESDAVGGKTIHERLDLFIEANTINGYLCVSNDSGIHPRLHTVVAEAISFDDRIEAVICNDYLIEKENEDKTAVINQTVYTHSKMVMKKIGDEWYITTLEFPLGNELIFLTD